MDARGPEKFNPEGDAATVSLNWRAWVEEFEPFVEFKGLFNYKDDSVNNINHSDMRRQRRAALLFYGGPRVRQIFKDLPNKGNDDNYDAAITALNRYFTVTPNRIFQRHMFRKAIQNQNETVAQYVSRLRTMTIGCEYADVDSEITDQVVCNCLSNSLRQKCLRKGATLNLERLLIFAATDEAVEQQNREITGASSSSVNRVGKGSRPNKSYGDKPKLETKSNECYRCGSTEHYGSNPKCPAKGKECRKCGKMDHFEKKCRTGEASNKSRFQPKHRGKKVNQINENSENSDTSGAENSEHVFTVKKSVRYRNQISVLVGGVQTKMLIDSGSDSNLIGKDTWAAMKKSKIQYTNGKKNLDHSKLYGYASDKPLAILGTFEAKLEFGGTILHSEFTVVDSNADNLLCYDDSVSLGVLVIKTDQPSVCNSVAPIPDVDSLCNEFSGLFSGLGLLKDREIQLEIDPSVKPVAQPHRRIPFGLRKKIESKIQELIDLDVIEQVKKPSDWVSPAHIVPKPNGDIRLTIDMREANKAVKRERHPIPTMEEMLLDMNQSKIFSKLDLKWGYHQIMLDEKSRNITTFSTHIGLFRYKRLLFGVNAAVEVYQHEIRRVIQGIPGVANMSDDIIVHGEDRAQHDSRLRMVFQRLQDAGLTLNREKCKFALPEIEFLGHKLSANGIDPGAGKVEAIQNARQPANAEEVRSFLGLVTYLCKFIPNLTEISEPLRKLTHGDCKKFKFGVKETQAFNKIKEIMSNPVTLGYFDCSAETKVIADASPIGLGAVLIQIQNGDSRIISYANRTLSDVERRYSQTEKEALALVWACERFESYLLGLKFDLVTDHQPLLTIYKGKKKSKRTSARIERWVLRLQPFEFNVVHIPGKSNIADPLSRLIKTDSSATLTKSQLEDMAFIRHVALESTPRALTTKQIERDSSVDSELLEVRRCVQFGDWSKFAGHKMYRAVADELCCVGNVLLRGSRIVIPKCSRTQVIELAHEGHLGIVGTKQNLRSKVWWPSMEKDAENYTRSCHGCQLTGRGLSKQPIRSTKLPSNPWEDLAADFLGPLPNGDNILVVVDYHSRFYEVRFMKTINSESTIDALSDIFYTHGLPRTLKTDNATTFTSTQFRDYCDHQGIKHLRITPRWPQANGEVERQNSSLMKRIEIAYSENKNYKGEVKRYITAYRNIPHPATGKSPAELLYGRKIRTKLPFLNENREDFLDVSDFDAEYKGKSKLYADHKNSASYSELNSGDKVLMKNPSPSKTDTPFYPEPVTVVSTRGSNVTVERSDGKRFDRNISHLKPYLLPCSPIVVDPEPMTTSVPDDVDPVPTVHTPDRLSGLPPTPAPPHLTPTPVQPRRSSRNTRPVDRYTDTWQSSRQT